MDRSSQEIQSSSFCTLVTGAHRRVDRCTGRGVELLLHNDGNIGGQDDGPGEGPHEDLHHLPPVPGHGPVHSAKPRVAKGEKVKGKRDNILSKRFLNIFKVIPVSSFTSLQVWVATLLVLGQNVVQMASPLLLEFTVEVAYPVSEVVSGGAVFLGSGFPMVHMIILIYNLLLHLLTLELVPA